MGKDKHQRGPDPRAAVAGPQTTLDDENVDKGMPSVGCSGLGYALPARADGNVYARPIVVTSVESTRQLVTGFVFCQPDDARPEWGVGDVAPGIFFVRDAKMGNPAEVGTCHWLASNYTGRSDGPGLTPATTETTQDVNEGN